MTLARDRQGEMRCSKADEKARDRQGEMRYRKADDISKR